MTPEEARLALLAAALVVFGVGLAWGAWCAGRRPG